MKLMTKDILKRLPAIGETSEKNTSETLVPVKFFDPCGSWSWFGVEYDPEEKQFFGYVKGFENELGYFSLTDLEQIKGPLGLGIERDICWNPKNTLRQVMDGDKS